MTLCWEGDVPLDQVLTHVRPAYGGDTWEEAFTTLTNSPSDAETIDHLARLGATGFNDPIRVIPYEWDDEPDDGFLPTDPDPFDRHWVVGNGMHRIATAARLGHATIKCTTESRQPEDPDNIEFIEVRFTLPGDWPDDHEHDSMAYASDWLRSFPLPDNTWIESDLWFGSGDIIEAMWYCPHRLSQMFFDELRRRCPTIVIVGSRLVTEAELDAEYEAEFGTEATLDTAV